MLGHVQWKLVGLANAIESFKTAVQLAPTLELASLGLFHALWEAGRRDDAFEEMKRFVRLAGPSTEYGEILKGLSK